MRSERVKYFSTREGKFRISKWPCNILLLNTNEILNHSRKAFLCNHSNSVIFTREDIMFSPESSLGISLVFIWAAYDGVLPRIPQVGPKSEIYTTERDNEHPRPFNLRVPPVAIIVP